MDVLKISSPLDIMPIEMLHLIPSTTNWSLHRPAKGWVGQYKTYHALIFGKNPRNVSSIFGP
jgi:hypothetical protein